MSSSNLIRWCGLAELLAGVLIALFLLLHSERDVASVLSIPYTAQHFLGIGAAILGLLGLIGLYAVQLQQAGWPGLIGFLLAFTGTALRVGQAFFDGVTIPLIATYNPDLLEIVESLFIGATALIFLLTGVTFILGFIIFGIVIMRVGMFPRPGGLLLIIGAPLLGLGPLMPVYVLTIGAIVFGLGQVWLGYALWTGTGKMTPQPEPAA